MEMSKHAKLLFVIFAASLLIVFLPLDASAQSSVKSASEGSTTTDNLYKYLHHVNVTQTVWPQGSYNASQVNFNPLSTAPSSNHILWVGKTRPYEALSTPAALVDGLVIVPNSGGQSIYNSNENVLYAFDENTGQVIWTYPGLSSAIVIDNGHMLCGTTMINPATGQYLYTVTRSVSLYVSSIKMGFANGPSTSTGGATTIAIDFSDPTNPKTAWTSAPYESITWWVYDNGVVFFGGRNSYEIVAADAVTGNIKWDVNCPEFITSALTGYGKLYVKGWTGSVCMDEATGNVLWEVPSHAREIGGASLAYGIYYVCEADTALYALDANTGAMMWKYMVQRTAPFPQGPANESLSAMGYASGPTVADGKVYYKSLGHTAYGRLLPPHWKSEDGSMWNPYNYPVLAQTGTGQLVCLNAYSGSLIWKCGPSEIGNPGIGLTTGGLGGFVGDGRLYVSQETYSGHVGVGGGGTGVPGTARPYGAIPYTQLINYEWYPPYEYCFGKGPTQFTNIAVNNGNINYGQSVTISGSLVDLSPPIDHISILSNYTRPVGAPAPNVPVVLWFSLPNGTCAAFATVNTDKNGKFSYTWYPWVTGPMSISATSSGSDSYEAPDLAYTSLMVNSMTPNMVPILEFALAVAIVVALALPIIVYIRKPKR